MKAILCSILMMAFLGINAQERSFQKLQKVEDFSWIVPLDFEQAMDSLILEACVKNFYVDGEFLDYTIGKKDEVDYVDAYGGWKTVIPDSLRNRLKSKGFERLGYTDRSCFETYALVNNAGKVLSVYFKIDSRLEDLVKEEELRAISDAIKNKGIDPGKFDFHRYDFAQMNKALWEMKNPKMSDKKRARIVQSCMASRRPCVYGVIRLCGIGGEKVFSTDDRSNGME